MTDQDSIFSVDINRHIFAVNPNQEKVDVGYFYNYLYRLDVYTERDSYKPLIEDPGIATVCLNERKFKTMDDAMEKIVNSFNELLKIARKITQDLLIIRITKYDDRFEFTALDHDVANLFVSPLPMKHEAC